MNIKHIKDFLDNVSRASKDCKVEFYLSSNGELIADFMACRDSWSHYMIHLKPKDVEDFLSNKEIADIYVDDFVKLFNTGEEATYDYMPK